MRSFLRLLSRSYSNTSRSSIPKNAKSALIVGAGESTGAAIARRFAADGYIVCVARRSGPRLIPLVEEIRENGGMAFPFEVDCRKEDDVISMVNEIEDTIAPLDVAVFNPGANIQVSILEMTSRKYYKVWEMACFSGFLVGREVAKKMSKRGHGTIIFTGATASIRGRSGFSAFAGAKHALRALAESMAHELGHQGIHVAHVIIDGAIDTPWIRENLPNAQKIYEKGGLLIPNDIAENYMHLHKQPRSSWTFELDLRPWIEKW